MKIGLVIDDTLDVADGVQQAVLTIGEQFVRQGHEVHYLTSNTARTDIPNVHSLAKTIKVSFNGNKMRVPLPASRRQIKKLLESKNFDVLHIQMPYSPFLAGRIIKLASKNTKIVGTFHILPYSKFSAFSTKILGLISMRTLSKFSEFISVSKPAADFCKNTYGVDSRVVPNPVNLSKFMTSKTEHSEIKRIVYLGRLVERKGVTELLNAYGEFELNSPEEASKTVLLIAGKGDLEQKLKLKAGTLSDSSRVKFLGFIDEKEKASLLASADLAVFPSLAGESFGIVLVEAMASGSKLILAGDNPGYASVMAPYPNLLVDPKDTKVFASKIKEYLEDSPSNKELSISLKNEVNKYDVIKVCSELLDLYNS